MAEAWWLGRPARAVPDRSAGPGRSRGRQGAGQEPEGRPFALVPALVLAGIISAVLPLAIWLEHRLGAAGAVAATATGAWPTCRGKRGRGDPRR